MANETFVSASLSMGSSHEALNTTIHAWTTEDEVPTHVPGPLIPFHSTYLASENPTITPMQKETSWMDPSLTAISDFIFYSPTQNHDAHVHGTPMVPAPPLLPCMLAGGTLCEQSLDGTLSSIRMHLFTHGHRHRGREIVQCPWTGCSDNLRWMNIPRHIRSVHLGVRIVCPNCRRSFTRASGLEKHVSSKNCSFFTLTA